MGLALCADPPNLTESPERCDGNEWKLDWYHPFWFFPLQIGCNLSNGLKFLAKKEEKKNCIKCLCNQVHWCVTYMDPITRCPHSVNIACSGSQMAQMIMQPHKFFFFKTSILFLLDQHTMAITLPLFKQAKGHNIRPTSLNSPNRIPNHKRYQNQH